MLRVEVPADQVHGDVDEGFGPVADAFRRNFAGGSEIGAACAVYKDGEAVVDLWGGYRDGVTKAPWEADTLVPVFSTTKGVASMAVAVAHSRGLLDYDAPVTRYWPEFGAAGKEGAVVRHLLCHQAGVPAMDADLTLEEVLAWDPVVAALAEQTPFWEPGTAHGYHAVTYGWLVGEVVRRITGKSLGQFFGAEVAGPLGLDFWIGLPASEEPRVAPLVGLAFERPTDEEQAKIYEMFLGPDTLTGRALMGPGNCFRGKDTWNRPDLHAAEIPAANGITAARSLSRMYAALLGEVDGVRLLKPETVERARTPLTEGADRVLYFDTKFGLGFMTDSLYSPFAGTGGFGHYGAGGSVGFAHPELGIAFGYVMNKTQQNLAGDPRTLGLIEAARQAVS